MLQRVRGWIFAQCENVILVLAILSHSSGLVVSSYIMNVDAVGFIDVFEIDVIYIIYMYLLSVALRAIELCPYKAVRVRMLEYPWIDRRLGEDRT